MRILHLIHSEGVYGAELILLYLAREQQQRGHEPIVGSIRDPGTPETPFESWATSWGLRVEPIRIAPRPTPSVTLSLLRTVRRLTPDVLHSHGYKSNVLLGPMPRSWRAPMLATLHGWTDPRRFSALWLYESLDRLALRRLDLVVVVTRSMLGLPALRGVAASRLQVVENGIPPLDVRLADLQTRSVQPVPADLIEFTTAQPTLVAIGRLSPEKGFLQLIEAFAQARAREASTHQLLIVGDGPHRAALTERIATRGLAGMVRLTGYLDGADRLLAKAAGFVVSSRTEGMPLVLLEALQWRVPILATAVGGIPEVLDGGQRGLLVPPDDLTALTLGLCHLMSAKNDGARTVSTDSAPAWDRYTTAKMTTEYLAAYAAIA